MLILFRVEGLWEHKIPDYLALLMGTIRDLLLCLVYLCCHLLTTNSIVWYNPKNFFSSKFGIIEWIFNKNWEPRARRPKRRHDAEPDDTEENDTQPKNAEHDTKQWVSFMTSIAMEQWKRISHKQSARWQHLSRLKASAFFSLQTNFASCMKCNNLYSGLVMPSSGWWSPIKPFRMSVGRAGAIIPNVVAPA